MSQTDREKWDARYVDADAAPATPSIHLTHLEGVLPRQGRALDIAGGAGRHATWLAKHGLDVTITDISKNGLRIAAFRAQQQGVKIKEYCCDLEADPLLPEGKFDVIVSFHYLQRSLWPAMRAALAVNAWLVFVQPTVRNLERHARPQKDYLLAEGEAAAVAEGLYVYSYREDWLEEGRHEAVVVARRRRVVTVLAGTVHYRIRLRGRDSLAGRAANGA